MKFIKLHINFLFAALIILMQPIAGAAGNENITSVKKTTLAGSAQSSVTSTSAWLEKMQKQAKISNFKGTVIMQKQNANSIKTRTFNITHFFEGSSEYEKITPLDGNMRFIVRINQVVQAYIEPKKIIISTKRDDAGFPFLTNNINQVSKLYSISSLSKERILGYNTDVFLLSPKNPKDKRYNYKIWTYNDLILKIQTSWQGKLLEQVFFADLQNIELNLNEIQDWMSYGKNWQYKLPRMQEVNLQKYGWNFIKEYKGYEHIKSMRKNTVNEKNPASDVYMHQVIYSDGLASISIFIESNPTLDLESALNKYKNINRGNNHIYTKNINGYSITAVGEAPASILEELINTINVPPANVLK